MMLVRFTSKAGPDIVMFEADAVLMLHTMNHSGAIPSAILANDIEEALLKLEAAALRESNVNRADAEADDGDEEKESVDFATRAFPLIQLLKAAHVSNESIMWNYSDGALV